MVADASRHPASAVLRDHADLLDTVSLECFDEARAIDFVRSNERTIRVLEGVGSAAAGRLEQLGGLSAEDVFATAGKHSTAEARRISRRATLAEPMPAVAAGFMGGAIATANIDAIAAARHRLRHNPSWVTALDGRDRSLARKAARMNPKRFAGWLRTVTDRISDDGITDQASAEEKNSFRSYTSSDGRWHGRLNLDAVSGEKVQNAIDAQARSIAKQRSDAGDTVHHGEQLNAAAICSLIDSGNVKKGRPSIQVIVDRDTLTGGVWDGTVKHTGAGTNLPLSQLQQMLCDAWITHTVLGPSGRALAVGRSHRTATDAQRTALRIMYPTCALCDVRFDYCEIHHIIEWEHGGPTDLNNLIPLCTVHHERVHKGWQLRLDGERTLTIGRPDGRTWKTIPLPSATPARTRQRQRRHRKNRHERSLTTTE
ncbi:MAG: DUF222 domain-containing protein [Acidimicrobiales bacterium]|nr:DUF222 domain-containing protein [Acidimicrobiales bacterium]